MRRGYAGRRQMAIVLLLIRKSMKIHNENQNEFIYNSRTFPVRPLETREGMTRKIKGQRVGRVFRVTLQPYPLSLSRSVFLCHRTLPSSLLKIKIKVTISDDAEMKSIGGHQVGVSWNDKRGRVDRGVDQRHFFFSFLSTLLWKFRVQSRKDLYQT